jgi:hypothetical protein
MIERQVPTTFDREEAKSGMDLRVRAQRMPIAIDVDGGAIRARTRILYGVRACRPPLPCLSCGLDEAMRVADVSLRSELSWDPRWFLRSKTTPDAPSFPNRCRVSLLNIDVTDLAVAPQIEQQLREVARSIDASTPEITNIATEAGQIWSSLQQPWELGSDAWLVFEPLDVVLSAPRGSGETLQSTLAIRAITRVASGQPPLSGTRPLPALRSGEVSNVGIRIPVDLQISHDEASRLLSSGLKPSPTFTIEALRVLPGSGTRLAVEATISHVRYRGPILLEGTPTFDAGSSSIVIHDLDYTLTGRRSPFFRVREKFAHEALRTKLQSTARVNLTTRLDQLRAEINRSLNRDLGQGVRLRGQVDSVAPTLIFSHDTGITVRVVATGRAEVVLSELATGR